MTSDRFFVLLSGTDEPNKQFLFVIKISDGTTLYKYYIDTAANTTSYMANNHFLFTDESANDPMLVVSNTEVYLALKTIDGAHFGMAKYEGLNSQSGAASWF